MSESVQKRYGRIKSKRHGELLKILEEIRFLFNSEIENEFVKTSNKNGSELHISCLSSCICIWAMSLSMVILVVERGV